MQYVAVAKLAYVPIVNTDEEVRPGNIGALQLGLQALLAEDAQDLNRAQTLWDQAKKLLADESEDDVGAGATGSPQVADQFQMCNVGDNIWMGDPYYG